MIQNKTKSDLRGHDSLEEALDYQAEGREYTYNHIRIFLTNISITISRLSENAYLTRKAS